MKKKLLIIIFVIAIIIGIIFLKISNLNEKNSCYIHIVNETGIDYKVTIKNNKLHVKTKESSSNTEENNSVKLTNEEWEKIKYIFDYLNSKLKSKKDNYYFYFDYDNDSNKLTYTDLTILKDTIDGIEGIALNDKKVEGETERYFGNEWLSDIKTRIIQVKDIGDDWIIKLTPNYLNSPSNQILIYKDHYIITYSFVTSDRSLVYYDGKIDSDFVNEINKEVEKLEKFDFDKNHLPISITTNDNKSYTVDATSELIKKISQKLTYNGKLWYVTINE